MDINRDNFNAIYPTFIEQLKSCIFYSIDEEMTGIVDNMSGNRLKYDDIPDKRYQNMIQVASKYNIIQFGISLFHQDSNDMSTIVATSYNFYIFPSGSNIDLTLSSSTIDFLCKNQMDFNEWFNKGITYVDQKGEAWAKKKFDLSPTTAPPTASPAAVTTVEDKKYIVLTKDTDIVFVEGQLSLIEAMCSGAGEATNIVVLADTNSFLRRVLYEQIELRFKDRVMIKKNDENKLCVHHIAGGNQAEIEANLLAEKKLQYFNMLGFRNVFNALVESKKPLVGHNLWFDLLFMIKWLDSALPATLEEFRVYLNSLFPYIYDTKFIASSGLLGEVLNESTLEQCFEYYNKNTTKASTIHITLNPIASTTNNKYHTAGYDAYITGYVFIKQIYQCIENQNLSNNTTTTLFSDMIKKVDCCNKLFMIRSFYHLILDPSMLSTEFKYTTGLMLRITKFNPTLTNNTFIQQLFLTANYASNEMYINWIDNDSFYIHILTYHKDDMISLNKYQAISWPIEWKVETFNEYLQNLEQIQSQVNEVIPEIALPSTEESSKKRKITSDSNTCTVA